MLSTLHLLPLRLAGCNGELISFAVSLLLLLTLSLILLLFSLVSAVIVLVDVIVVVVVAFCFLLLHVLLLVLLIIPFVLLCGKLALMLYSFSLAFPYKRVSLSSSIILLLLGISNKRICWLYRRRSVDAKELSAEKRCNVNSLPSRYDSTRLMLYA